MKILSGGDAELERPTAVTVGVFDGVHLGHRQVLEEVQRIAEASDLLSVVVMPDRHPATIVRPSELPRLLTDIPQRLEVLDDMGIDVVDIIRFDEERSLQTAEEFVSEHLVGRLHARFQVGGEDFHFGHRRKGDAASVADVGSKHGMKVVSLPLLQDEQAGGAISSSKIRAQLAAGDIGIANHMLGRAHEVRGVVEHGDARGRTIGFPTANVAVPAAIALPSDGVYAGWYVGPDGVPRASAINIGRRPTFYDDHGLLLVEAHLIDFDGDLYGQHAHVRVTHRLRDEIKFSGIDALAEQLRADVQHAREVLA